MPSLNKRLIRFLRRPWHDKLNSLHARLARVKTELYYRRIFGTMGRGCLIYKPLLLSNPRFIHIGDSTMIRKGARMETIVLDEAQPPSLVIGKNVNIEQNVHLICSSRLAIGDGSVLSGSVYMNDCSHGLDPAAGLIIKQPLIHGGDVVIGKGCFLGIRSAIMPGVILGDHCVVGANSVVTKSFPAYSMVAGAPARLIRRYDHEKKAWV